MLMTKARERKLLAVLLIVLAVLYVYGVLKEDAPRTMPLQYTRGMKVAAPLRRGISGMETERDPISLVLARRLERYPGVKRDLFRMQGDGTIRKTGTATRVETLPTPTLTTDVTPTIPQKTPEQIAADDARTDLSLFRFLGYLTDPGKENSLFLSKDGELFIAKSGDRLLKNYRVKESGKDFVVLLDTATKVEVRIELTGSGDGGGR